MNEQSTGPAREFVAVEKLTGGEHVNHQADQFADVMTWQVGHVAPYSDDNSVPMVALTLTPVGGGEPALIRERHGVTLPLSTDAEIAEAVDAGRRFALAQALRALADDIAAHNLPVTTSLFYIGPGVVDSRADLNRWAAYFGAEVTMGGTDKDIPVVDASRPVMDGLKLSFHAQCSPEPEPEPVVKPLQVDAAIAAAAALEPKLTGEKASCGCVIEFSPIENRERISHDPWCEIPKPAADAQAGE